MMISAAARAALLGVLMVGAAAVHAGMLGKTVALDQLYPAIDEVALSVGTATVGPGVEFTTDYDWDIGDASISFSRLIPCCHLSYTPSGFNGFRLSFSGEDLPPIVGVGLLEVVGFASFGPERISFDASNVYINLGGIEESFDSAKLFGVRVGLQLPEPGTLALVALALLGMTTKRRLSGSVRAG